MPHCKVTHDLNLHLQAQDQRAITDELISDRAEQLTGSVAGIDDLMCQVYESESTIQALNVALHFFMSGNPQPLRDVLETAAQQVAQKEIREEAEQY